VGLLAASLLLLPVIPAAAWKPSGAENPTLRILGLLAATVGLPYFMLSTTGPLIQAWHVRKHQGAFPYRLYALSNLGSMLALLTYPVLLEPYVATRAQAKLWSLAYAGFVALTLAAALGMRRIPAAAHAAVADAQPAPTWRIRLIWILLPACASAMLLAVTNHMTQNVAAIPFLWVLPLCLYLLTFIICFDRETWYRRTWFLVPLALTMGGMAYALLDVENVTIKPLILLFSAGLFCGCMVCHGELVRLKPHPRHLTSFYLMISLGGALGGLFVGLIAPYLFNGDYELALILALCTVLAALLGTRRRAASPRAWVAYAAAAAIIATLGLGVRNAVKGYRLRVRNFYGCLRVMDEGTGDGAIRTLMHGAIDHGEQYLSPSRSRWPTTYYGPNTGVGLAIRSLEAPGQRMGFIGLGAGTLAAYGRKGDSYRFYEINPLVEQLAAREFHFLRESRATVSCALGDARLTLEREPAQGFDLLAVDAFSGDSIPVHLLTREAFALYFRHLKPDGILAVHLSNRYLDLDPVVERAAQAMGKRTLLVDSEDQDDTDVFGATWVLVTGAPARFQAPLLQHACTSPGLARPFRIWTDDYSNLFKVLK
jgi:SAM-dependent methyltransferase